MHMYPIKQYNNPNVCGSNFESKKWVPTNLIAVCKKYME
jgi:hypothetical protein